MLAWFVELIIHYKYAILILIAIPEGPVVMLLSGGLIRLGHLSFWPAYVALMAGDLIADIAWYCVGYYGGMRFVDRFGKFFGITREKVEIVGKFFHKYHNWILFISKITTGFGFALVTLMTAGLVKIPFKKYLLLNFIGQFFWTGGLIALGYAFGHLYVTISDVLGRITLVGVVFLALVFVYNVGKHIRKNMEKAL